MIISLNRRTAVNQRGRTMNTAFGRLFLTCAAIGLMSAGGGQATNAGVIAYVNPTSDHRIASDVGINFNGAIYNINIIYGVRYSTAYPTTPPPGPIDLSELPSLISQFEADIPTLSPETSYTPSLNILFPYGTFSTTPVLGFPLSTNVQILWTANLNGAGYVPYVSSTTPNAIANPNSTTSTLGYAVITQETSPPTVPEPSSFALLAIGGISLGYGPYRRPRGKPSLIERHSSFDCRSKFFFRCLS